MAGSRKKRNIASIILAAGGSLRMGSPKQLLIYQGRSFLRRTVECAMHSEAAMTYVIIGAEAAWMEKELSGLPVHIIENPRWQEGLSVSIHAGIGALPETTDAALLMLCDQPNVSTDLINTIIARYLSSNKKIVACTYGGSPGVPALFERSLFAELLALAGDKGAKAIIHNHAADTVLIPFPEGEIDIDTPSDYETLKR